MACTKIRAIPGLIPLLDEELWILILGYVLRVEAI